MCLQLGAAIRSAARHAPAEPANWAARGNLPARRWRVFGQPKNPLYLLVFLLAKAVHQIPDIVPVHPFGQARRQSSEVWPIAAEIKEVVERDQGATQAAHGSLVWADPNPVDLASHPVSAGFGANTANSNDSAEVTGPNCPHAVMDPEATFLVGVTVVGPLVDQYPSLLTRRFVPRNDSPRTHGHASIR
jgi:hypothetical protein